MSAKVCPVGAPIVDYFDHNAPAYTTMRFEWFENIRNEVGPIFWSPNYGGYWVIIGYQEVTKAAKDWEHFSSRPSGFLNEQDPDLEYNGLFIPPRGSRNQRPGRSAANASRLLQEDPPEWLIARKALTPLFAVSAAEQWRDRIQCITDAVIDKHIEKGSIDFAADLASIIPAIVSMELAGVTAKDFQEVAKISNLTAHLAADDPRWADIMVRDEKIGMASRIKSMIELRKNDRRNDVISMILNGIDAGAPYTEQEIIGMTLLLISAGIDTTAGLICTTAINLMQHPNLIERLKSEPDLTKTAFHEFMRIGGPTQGLCRTVTKDIEFCGHKMRRGDPVMLVWAAANRDPNKFECPNEIRLDRAAASQVGFGFGNHRCLGQPYAQLEFEIIFNTVLRRMPDIKIDISRAQQHENSGIVSGWISLPSTFTPGQKLNVDPGIEDLNNL